MNGTSPPPPPRPGQPQTTTQTVADQLLLVDVSRYEAALIDLWEHEAQALEHRRGSSSGFDFDWEIEKVRRYFAGLRRREDGTWVQEKNRAWPLLSDFLLQQPSSSSLSSSSTTTTDDDPTPPTPYDVMRVVVANVLMRLWQRPFGGATPVPNAVIQKYEGSFFSFIKGVLGGDLQTLAGGPLFLLLNKYFQTYGPIFNLSFGPKSFLVISDPVMAKAVLKSAPPQ